MVVQVLFKCVFFSDFWSDIPIAPVHWTPCDLVGMQRILIKLVKNKSVLWPLNPPWETNVPKPAKSLWHVVLKGTLSINCVPKDILVAVVPYICRPTVHIFKPEEDSPERCFWVRSKTATLSPPSALWQFETVPAAHLLSLCLSVCLDKHTNSKWQSRESEMTADSLSVSFSLALFS